MKPLKLLDAFFLQVETAQTPMHVGALFVLQPASDRERSGFFRRFRARVAASLGRSEVFTRRVAALPFNVANPFWISDGDVDLDYHVRRTVLPKPGTRHQLEECVADLHAELMDRLRPLWELHVIEGLEDGRIALYVKTHHAGLDGASAQIFLQSFVDTAPVAARGRARASTRPPPGEDVGLPALVAAGFRHQAGELLRLPRTLGGLAGSVLDLVRESRPASRDGRRLQPAPRTPLNGVIDGRRGFSSCEFPLADAKAIARAADATINDLVLAACAGALRRWLLARDALPPGPLRVAVPFSTRDAGDVDHSIRVSFMGVDLHTEYEEPLERLGAIHASAAESKGTAAKLKTLVPGDLPSVGLPWLFGSLSRLVGRPEIADRLPLPANVIISNVAGPPVPLYVAGLRAVTYTPVSIPFHTCALNVTVYSYDGKLFFGLTSASSALPDVHRLADDVLAELHALQQATARPRRRGSRRRAD